MLFEDGLTLAFKKRYILHCKETTKIFLNYAWYVKRKGKMELTVYNAWLKPEKEESLGKRGKEQCNEKKKSITNMGDIILIILIITLNMNGLNIPIRREIAQWMKNQRGG